MKSSPPSETRPAKRVGSFSRTAESGVGSVIHLRSRSTSRTAQDDQEMALADDPLKRLRSLGWAADGHELDENPPGRSGWTGGRPLGTGGGVLPAPRHQGRDRGSG